MINNKKVGLALSGGGYRAAAYHLGTLKKLHELGILYKVDVISTISGGSIIGAYYGLHRGEFNSFEQNFRNALQTSVIKGIIYSPRLILILILSLLFICLIVYFLFTDLAWVSFLLLVLFITILIKNQFKIFPISDINETLYNKIFFKDAKLKDLCSKPVIAINTTNLETGRPLTFSHSKMSDSTYEYPTNGSSKIEFKPREFPVARAVAASTCVPFAFTPIKINKDFFKNPSDYNRIKPTLIDGGVYDNQGIHKLTQKGSSYECDIIIVSDAGNNLPSISLFKNTLSLLIRTSDVFMQRIKNFQMMYNIYNMNNSKKKEIAYQSLGWDHANCINGCVTGILDGHLLEATVNAHGITKIEIDSKDQPSIERRLIVNTKYEELLKRVPSEQETNLARSISTNLTTLSEKEVSALIKHSEVLTELQIRLYCPSLLVKEINVQ